VLLFHVLKEIRPDLRPMSCQILRITFLAKTVKGSEKTAAGKTFFPSRGD